MEISWNKEKLTKLLQQEELMLFKKFDLELVLEVSSLRTALELPSLVTEYNDKKEKYQNNPNDEILKEINQLEEIVHRLRVAAEEYPVINDKAKEVNKALFRMRLIRIPLKRSESLPIHIHKVAKITRECLDDNDKAYMDELMKNRLININNSSSEYSYTNYLNHSKTNLINIGFIGELGASRILMHEMGHATQHSNIENFNMFYNLTNSNFKEVKSILYELIFLDRAKEVVPEEMVINNKTLFLSEYQKMLRNGRIESFKLYNQSLPLAFYLF